VPTPSDRAVRRVSWRRRCRGRGGEREAGSASLVVGWCIAPMSRARVTPQCLAPARSPQPTAKAGCGLGCRASPRWPWGVFPRRAVAWAVGHLQGGLWPGLSQGGLRSPQPTAKAGCGLGCRASPRWPWGVSRALAPCPDARPDAPCHARSPCPDARARGGDAPCPRTAYMHTKPLVSS